MFCPESYIRKSHLLKSTTLLKVVSKRGSPGIVLEGPHIRSEDTFITTPKVSNILRLDKMSDRDTDNYYWPVQTPELGRLYGVVFTTIKGTFYSPK